MRLRLRDDPGPGALAMPVEGPVVCGRQPEWILTEGGQAGLAVPALRKELDRLPAGTRRIVLEPGFRGGEPVMRIMCLDRELEGVFLRFCEAVLEELREGRNAREAVLRALDRFRQLFERTESPVPVEQIMGLLAELAVLERLLEAGLDAVPAWRGPFGAAHDFRFEAVDLEVKVLPATGARRFRVSSIHQLQEPPGGQLYLLGLRVGPGSETVGERYTRVRRMVQPDRLGDLDRAMAAAGCPVPVGEHWNSRGFCVHDAEAWRVMAGFPRLVPADLVMERLPPGVSDVRYTVSLEAAQEFLAGEQEVLEAIRRKRMR